MIEFKKIKWKNLLSTGNVFTEISLNEHKSSLIVGQNGAGKSTILDALSFVLYGKPFRKINKQQLVNTINTKNCVVELEFSTGKKNYKVIRGIKPNVFEIYCNDQLIDQAADAKDYQEMLEKTILKLNHKSFSQIVILGSASFVPFMQLSAAHRREIIEDLLDIQIFSVMNSLLKDKIALNKSELTDVKYKIEATSEKIDIHQKHLDELKQDNTQQIQDKNEKIEKLKRDIVTTKSDVDAVTNQINALQQQLVGKTKAINKQTKLSDFQRQINERQRKAQKEMSFFEKNTDCPTCSQSISIDFRSQMIKSRREQIEELSNGLAKLENQLTGVVEEVGSFVTLENQIIELNKQNMLNNSKISGWNELINELNVDIATLQQKSLSIESNSTEIQQLQQSFTDDKLKKEQLESSKKILEFAALLLKDSGIKTKIIKQYIPVINKLINKYLASMDFFVNFELDENFEEKIKSRFRDEFSYASFSEGEKARLDLALLFTWRSIAKLRNSASTNLLILDEVFDGSLDTTGNDELLKILQTLTQGNNVFVISHKTDAYLDKFDKVIKFEKHKNFSRVVES